MARVSKEDYYMKLARVVAERATCDRRHVGAVIIKDGRVLATGYNGAPVGEPHCDDVGHEMVAGHCRRAVHAEVNAVANAARFGVTTTGATMYVTFRPCNYCRKVMKNAGIMSWVYDEEE